MACNRFLSLYYTSCDFFFFYIYIFAYHYTNYCALVAELVWEVEVQFGRGALSLLTALVIFCCYPHRLMEMVLGWWSVCPGKVNGECFKTADCMLVGVVGMVHMEFLGWEDLCQCWYTCMHKTQNMHTHTHTCAHACMHTRTHTHTHTHKHIHPHTHPRMHTYTQHMHAHSHTHPCMHTHLHTCMHAYTHICTCMLTWILGRWYTCMHKTVRAHICMHTHTHAYTHARTHTKLCTHCTVTVPASS